MKLMGLNSNRKGQSAVEFTIVVLVVFFFLLFFLSLSFVLILSQYMDYATFMAARTYKSAHGDRAAQEDKARRVFNDYSEMVKGSGLVRVVYPLEFVRSEGGGREYSTEGVRSRYELDLFYLPPIFLNQEVPSRIVLTSESFLGRDPNIDECRGFFANFAARFGIQMQGGSSDLTSQMEDNGC